MIDTQNDFTLPNAPTEIKGTFDVLPKMQSVLAVYRAKGLPTGEQEWVMYKSRWGAFYKTDLEQFLRDRGIDTIVFTGCNFPNCPRTSMYEASERDFRVVMVADSMSQVYKKGIQEMSSIGVYVCGLDDVLNAIK
jgi:nicotinamidase-related amidase